MRKTLPHIALLAFLTVLPVPAEAGISGWAENPGGRMRVIALPPEADGVVRGAVQIEPAAGWITYWREPGEAGIPPRMTVAPESGYSLDYMGFPAPRIFEQNGLRDIGYDAPVTLFFTLEGKGQTADPVGISLFIGVCKEICVPFQADFSVPLAGDGVETARIVKLASQSMPAPSSPGFSAGRPQAEKDQAGKDGASVTVPVTLPDTAENTQLILTGPDGYVYLDPEWRTVSGQQEAVFTIGELPKNYDFHGQTWKLLAISGTQAMETPIVFD